MTIPPFIIEKFIALPLRRMGVMLLLVVRLIWCLALMLVFPILELIKRPLFMLFYFPAYHYRKEVRAICRNRWYTYLLWLVLDDSINTESRDVFGHDVEYCWYGKRNKYIEKWLPEGDFKEFARSFYWGSWRNNGINLTWVIRVGDRIAVLNHFGSARNFLEIRRYPKGIFPYSQFYVTTEIRFKDGWLTNGRFEIQCRKKDG